MDILLEICYFRTGQTTYPNDFKICPDVKICYVNAQNFHELYQLSIVYYEFYLISAQYYFFNKFEILVSPMIHILLKDIRVNSKFVIS